MKDLTQGRIGRLLVAMAVPIAIGMLFQTLYFLVDLYFVSRLGDAAIAGVSTAGTVSFVILALTQMLGVGTVALVSHAAGRKDQAGSAAVRTSAGSRPMRLRLRRAPPISTGIPRASRCSLHSSPWARRCAGLASSSRRCSCRC
jgi:hypothetical protein